MLSAICGLIFADLTARRPVIDWRDGSYAPLDENAYPLLFDSPITARAEDFDGYDGPVSPAIWQGELAQTPTRMIDRHADGQHSGARIYRRFCTDLARLDAPEDLAVFWCYLPKFGRLAPLLRRDPRFRDRPLAQIINDYLTRYFTPNARVRAAVQTHVADFGGPFLGAHVRYTDRKVPVHRIEAALDARLKQMPDAAVFLATDSAEIQERFARRYARLSFTDKYLPPDGSLLHWPNAQVEKVREAENALVDMQILSRAAHLVCSRHSTFSETAILYGLMAGRFTDIDRYNPKVVIKRVAQNHL